ncbi:MAG TPA: pilus assembly protein PilZ, partial [Anaeromyxobacteraceae bacterium]|nr:pilus assembly protein PilZ [Anaeromyxobacteraceae bacterium]
MSPAGATPVASRVLVVGSDTDVSIALHLHLERAGYALYCLPSPAELEPIMRVVAPHAIVLMLPAAPDGTWGGALTAAAGAARVGVRIAMVGPAREVVEPLAAVAGAERALSRAEVLARPIVVMEKPLGGLAGQPAAPRPAPRPAGP